MHPQTNSQSNHKGRVWWTVAFVLWICVIWGHSLIPADASSAESAFFVPIIKPLLTRLGIWDMHLATHIIRKTAHFSEYAILCMIAIGTARSWRRQERAIVRNCVFAIWVVIPCIDETIQLFVPGRAGRITDVCIDMAGGLLGMVIAQLYLRRKRA